MTWLAGERPDLVARYQSLYAHGVNAAPSYQNAFEAKVRPLLDKHGFAQSSRHRADPMNPSDPTTTRVRTPRRRTPARPPRRPAPLPHTTPDLDQQTLF